MQSQKTFQQRLNPRGFMSMVANIGELSKMMGIGAVLSGLGFLVLIFSQWIDELEFFLQVMSTELLGLAVTFVAVYWALRLKSLREPLGLYLGALVGSIVVWVASELQFDIWNDLLSAFLVELIGSFVAFLLFMYLFNQMLGSSSGSTALTKVDEDEK